MSSRQGCAAAAMVAAAPAPRTFFSPTTATSVSASPLATPPALRRSAARALTTSLPVVSHNPINVFPLPLGPPPGATLAGQHLVGRARSPLTGAVRLRLGPRPGLLEGVDH